MPKFKLILGLLMILTITAACTDNGDKTPVEVETKAEMKIDKI